MKENILAIDHGTQSVRALLFDPQGTLLARTKVDLDPYYSTQTGWAEQDPEYFWDSLCQACELLWQQPGVGKDSIAAVSLTTQRSTLINLDAEGNPLRPAIVWPDDRRTKGLKPVGGFWGLLFLLAGASETVAILQSQAESNWIQENQPEIWKKTARFVFLSGFLTHRLVGEYVDSVASQVGYMPFDYKNLAWSKKWDWKWDAVRIPPDMLVDLIPPSESLGQITPKASEATGIPAGLPLISAAADKACEVIGAGCLDPHIGCLSYGTTATINTTQKKYIEAIPLLPPYPAAVPDHYSLEIQIYRGFWMVTWFKQEFGLREKQLAGQLGLEPEAMFDELLDSVPPGSEGLLLQPYWTPGIRVPGPEARGAIIGFNDSHTRAHIYRAMIEGLAFALREGADQSAKRSHIPITELRVAGGGSQSNAAMQITADIFGLPTSRPLLYDASGLGAAIDAAVGVGLYPDFPTAVVQMTHLGDTFLPNPATHALYQELYEKVYLNMYDRVKPLYQAIRRIIGS